MSGLPPLRALQVFETVGHSQNIQEAAQRLGISPSAVSQQLQQLEQHLRVALFFKDGRQLRLTAAGLDYHQRTTVAFEQLREAQTRLSLDQQQLSLAISALPSFLNDWLLPRASLWQQQHPTVSMRWHGSHHEPDYANEQVDFRFTYAQSVPQNLHWIELFTDQVIPVCRPELLTPLTIKQPEDLRNLPMISVDWQPRFSSPPTWSEWFATYAKKDSIAENSYATFSLSHQALQAVRQGKGIMLAQRAYVQTDLDNGTLCAPFEQYGLSLAWPYVMTWQPSVFNKPHARDFHRFILEQKPKLGAPCR